VLLREAAVSTAETPRIAELRSALDRGDLDSVRRTLLTVDGREAELLQEGMGAEAFERARQAAASGRRRGKLGKVLVLPGIMGTELDAVDRKGDVDRIWIDFVRLLAGRIGDLELTPDGNPARAGVQIRPAGLHNLTYVPILLELDTRWHVRPFPFDWREDIDKSAERLDAEITSFGAGDPVHLVAHSMGGLVSRRFMQKHPATWKAMDDTTGAGRGGRLLMLGTPNRGSFAIPLTLSGAEKILKALAVGDIHHSMNDLLEIISTFPGLYQMLPSPIADLGTGEDHKKLYDVANWGALPAKAPHLARADAFMRDLDAVIDPDRLLYVAGFDRDTPVGIRIESPGKFSYRKSRDGDGRVPHALGLLEQVKTYWVNETHGDLAKNVHVLDAVHELLQKGTTTVLAATKPAARRAAPVQEWEAANDVAPLPTEARAIAEKGKVTRRTTGKPSLTPEEQTRLRNLTLSEYLGSDKPMPDDGPGRRRGGGYAEEMARLAEQLTAPTPAPRHKVSVEVVWGDVVAVDADVHAVGHYQGVLPQNAEKALDCAVSGLSWSEGKKPENTSRLVITEHTRRGILRGALGDVDFFPLPTASRRGRVVAVAGMGYPGTFDLTALRLLYRELTLAVMALPKVNEICTVLVGSGEGTLSVERATRGLLEGIGAALAARDESAGGRRVPTFRIVELYRDRAEEIRRALVIQSEKVESLELVVAPEVIAGVNGRVSVEGCLELVIDSTLRAARSRSRTRGRMLYDNVMRGIPTDAGLREMALATMNPLVDNGRHEEWQRRYRVVPRPSDEATDVPTRISFTWDTGVIRIAAITAATTVSERLIRIDKSLIDELVTRMTDPTQQDLMDESDDPTKRGQGLSRDLALLLIPREFRDVVQRGPYVIEVDRTMAHVHWEACSQFSGGANLPEPMGVAQLARQLRTTYSPAPAPPPHRSGRVRALVIGDPGDPDKNEDLPGAREEALAVHELLLKHHVDSVALIGAPDAEGRGPIPGIPPAGRLEVLRMLLRGGLDLVHYAGHGDFDEVQRDRAGWLFKGGLLTSAELARIDEVPSLVVANACLSARTAQTLAAGGSDADPRSEAALLPSLADEFFHLGVRNYIGTAWEVNDIGATLFAQTFYETLFSASYGEVVKTARRALYDQRAVYGPLWAAYQHYGDPTSRLRAVSPEAQDESEPA